eukprot:324146-Chlamydomonas_euryale.AAC.3
MAGVANCNSSLLPSVSNPERRHCKGQASGRAGSTPPGLRPVLGLVHDPSARPRSCAQPCLGLVPHFELVGPFPQDSSFTSYRSS